MTGTRAYLARAGLLLFIAVLAFPAFPQANEAAIWELWKVHVTSTNDHQTALAACRDYLRAHGRDPLAPVARDIAAWHLLKLGQTKTAVEFLSPALTDNKGVVERGAKRLAQGWVTRVDREEMAQALQAYYRKEVEYPPSFEAFSTHPKADTWPDYPATDRWGKPWSYVQKGLPGVAGFRGQSYALTSRSLRSTSVLAEALALPYAGQAKLEPRRVFAVNNTPMVEFSRNGNEVVAIAVGKKDGDTYLAYAGRNIIVACDENHWILLRTP